VSSELYTSPETNVINFVDQLKRVVTSALDAICPAKTRRVRFSRRRRSPLSAEATMAKWRHRRLERCWIRSGRKSDKEDFRRSCRDTNRLINESRRQLVCSRIGQCVNARQRWSAVRKLLHEDDQSARLSQPHAKIALASRGFRHTGPSIWNSLPPHFRSIDTYIAFKSNLKTHLFCSASISGP